jgi:hypothetical protein
MGQTCTGISSFTLLIRVLWKRNTQECRQITGHSLYLFKVNGEWESGLYWRLLQFPALARDQYWALARPCHLPCGCTLCEFHSGRGKPQSNHRSPIIAAPSESPGHQLVRVHSQGQTFYCLGDLYHHPVEVEVPTWMATWANPDTNISSRQSLVEAALAEDALLVAAHMPIGRLQSTLSGIKWVEV